MEGRWPAFRRLKRLRIRLCSGTRLAFSGLEGCSYEGHWEAQRKTEHYSAYLIASLYADLGEERTGFPVAQHRYNYERDRLRLGLKADFPLDSLTAAVANGPWLILFENQYLLGSARCG